MSELSITVNVHGLRELEEELAKFGPEIARKILRPAVRKSSETMRAEASRLAPRSTQARARHLQDNVVVRLGVKRGRSFIETLFGVETGSVTASIGFQKKTFWGMFQELGTSKHQANPFLRPAFDNESANSVRLLSGELKRGIEAHAKKVARRFARLSRKK